MNKEENFLVNLQNQPTVTFKETKVVLNLNKFSLILHPAFEFDPCVCFHGLVFDVNQPITYNAKLITNYMEDIIRAVYRLFADEFTVADKNGFHINGGELLLELSRD
jgi:hypothetical protein